SAASRLDLRTSIAPRDRATSPSHAQCSSSHCFSACEICCSDSAKFPRRAYASPRIICLRTPSSLFSRFAGKPEPIFVKTEEPKPCRLRISPCKRRNFHVHSEERLGDRLITRAASDSAVERSPWSILECAWSKSRCSSPSEGLRLHPTSMQEQ